MVVNRLTVFIRGYHAADAARVVFDQNLGLGVVVSDNSDVLKELVELGRELSEYVRGVEGDARRNVLK